LDCGPYGRADRNRDLKIVDSLNSDTRNNVLRIYTAVFTIVTNDLKICLLKN